MLNLLKRKDILENTNDYRYVVHLKEAELYPSYANWQDAYVQYVAQKRIRIQKSTTRNLSSKNDLQKLTFRN